MPDLLSPQAFVTGDVAVDAKGFIYMAGTINNGALLTTPGALRSDRPADCSPDPARTTCKHGFIAKIDPSGETLVWATYLAGDGQDSITGLAVDAAGNVVVAGATTSKNLLLNLGGYRSAPSSLFVAKLSSDGKSLLAGTYFGGSGRDVPGRPKLDANGNIYFAGTALSADFPTTGKRLPSAPAPPAFICTGQDEFLAKFDSSLSKLLFSVRIGSDWSERLSDFAIGPDNTVYLAGTRGTERGPCQGFPILTRVTNDASAVLYSVVLPGGLPYGAYALAVASDGSAYAAGDTRAWSEGNPDATLWKVDSKGNVQATRTLPGFVFSMAVSPSGELVVVGSSSTVGGCNPAGPFTVRPFIARLNGATLEDRYSGPGIGQAEWLVSSEQIVVRNPYFTARPFGVLRPDAPPPGTVTCVANAASFAIGAVAPGEIVTIFGNQIGPPDAASAQLDAQGNVTSELNGVRVLAGGLPAPLLYAGPNQINLVMPFGIPASDRVRLEIFRGGELVEGVDEVQVPVHSGAFVTDNSKRPSFLAALNQDGSINSLQNPARPGSVISIFLTGMGRMTPQPVDGSRPGSPVATPVVLPSQVIVADHPAVIEYVGNAPTLVHGLVQMNVRLPDSIADFYLSQGATYIQLIYDPNNVGQSANGQIAVR